MDAALMRISKRTKLLIKETCDDHPSPTSEPETDPRYDGVLKSNCFDNH